MYRLKTVTNFAPLVEALRQIELQLQARGESRVMVAAEKRTAFKRQRLGNHNKITVRKLVGERVPVRGRRRTDQSRIISARWPESKMHESTHPVLNVILKGQADMQVMDYSVCCHAGDMLLVPAGLAKPDASIPDYVDIMPYSACDIMMFSPGLISGFGLEFAINHSRGAKRIQGNIDERAWVKNHLVAQLYAGLCEELFKFGNSKSTFYLLMLLLVQLRRDIEEGNAMVGWPFAVSAPAVKQNLIGRAIEYIHDHIGERLTIDIVARQIAVSRTVFTTEFRRETGFSFKDYLTKQRLEMAKVLLREANLPVNDVAQQIGLSPRRLRSLFQEKYQYSPDEFRNT